MAIIYTYPEINQVEGEDLLLISDTSLHKRPTRSVTIDNLAAYIGTVVGVVQNLQSVLTVGNTYVSPDGYGTFTLNDITNNNGNIKYVNTDESWGYFLNAEEGLFFTDETGNASGKSGISGNSLYIGNDNYIGELTTSNITANRIYSLPNTSGTIALTSDIPSPGPSGSGTTNYVARWTSASTLGIGALYDNGADVGIGINGTYTNPPQRLTVVSDDNLQPVAQFKNIGNGGGLFVRTDSTTRPLLELFSGSSYRFVFTGTGNLGIGTTSPDSLLEISTTDITKNFVKLTSGAGGVNPALVFEKSAVEQGVIQYIRNGDLKIYNTDSDGGIMLSGSSATNYDMYINHSGNVGIGTTSPEVKLTIKGDALNTNQPVRITNSVTDTHTGLFLNNTGGTVGEKYGMQFGGYNQYSIGGIFGVLDSTSGSTSGDITFDLGNGTASGALVERMRITHEGNVGIGTPSPGYKLHNTGTTRLEGRITLGGNVNNFLEGMAGGINFKSANDTSFIKGSNTNLIIKDSGNVGIGTTSPNAKLNVNGDIKIEGENELYFGGSGSVPSWEIKASGSDLVINDTGTTVGSVLFNNDEGIVLPRLTTTEINAISLPNTGLTVYNTTLNTLCFYNGSSWQKVSHTNM